MAGIAKRVKLYNLAYRLAWKYISEEQKLRRADIAGLLHDSIRRQIREGATEAVFIASQSLEDLEFMPAEDAPSSPHPDESINQRRRRPQTDFT